MKDDDTCWYVLGSENIGFSWKCSCHASLPCACVCVHTVIWFCAFSFIYYTHILTYFSTGYGECLLDEPVGRTYELPTLLPGQIYNANRQCELMFGPGSQICPYMVSWPAIKASKTTLKKWGILLNSQPLIKTWCRAMSWIWNLVWRNQQTYFDLQSHTLPPKRRKTKREEIAVQFCCQLNKVRSPWIN